MKQRNRLQYLSNKYGNFRITQTYLDKQGSKCFGKWQDILSLSFEDKYNVLECSDNRQILSCEVIIDLDFNPSLLGLGRVCDTLDRYEQSFVAYYSGGKGYHVHVYNPELAVLSRFDREMVRAWWIKLLKGDLMKKSDACMIAMEGCKHWRSGKCKVIVRRSQTWDWRLPNILKGYKNEN